MMTMGVVSQCRGDGSRSVGYSLLLPSTQPTVCVALFFVLFVSVPTLFCVVVDL